MKTFTMKFLFHPEHFTFTHRFGGPHFNKSLLKSRIEMMNRTKSKWLGLGKYGLFIGMLWFCAAFTKPYQVKVAAKIVEKVPELKEFAENKTTIKPTLKDVVFQETSLNKKTKITKATLPPPVDKLVSQTKYVLFKEGYIEWILTPMIKRSDFVAIQKEFHKINYVFSVTHIEYDPLSHHLLDAGLRIDRNEKGKSLTHEHFYPKFKIPVTGIYGTIDIKTGYATIGGQLSKSPLYQVALDDQKIADDWVGENREKYLEFELNEHRNKNTVHSLNFSLDNLNYLSQTGVKNRVYFDKNRKLRFEEFPGRTELVIDGKTNQLSNAEKLSFGDITCVNFHDFYPPSDTIRHYSVIAIYTKKFKKLP
ncbi:hypothetical protein [Runella sp.]|uniref:hypothetical protein n=1 Tax=Runella sp. TaxID=1960881 RepID=UPI0030187A8B